jgi:hypothetical protein
MSVPFGKLIKDINKVDVQDITQAWLWKLQDQRRLFLISVVGDLFFIGNKDEVNWLDVGSGDLQTIAEDVDDFKQRLHDSENIENWFLESIVQELYKSGQTLADNEVFSYKTLPIMGGDYNVSNFAPTDMSVHFTLAGQIHEQIKDLPDGTQVNLKVVD